ALVLIVVAVDVDDQHAVEVALVGLAPRMGEQPGGVEFLNRHSSTAVGDEIHGVSPNKLTIGQRIAAQSSRASSWPGLSRPSTPCLPTPRKKDVDARDNPRIKSGDRHDGSRRVPGARQALQMLD